VVGAAEWGSGSDSSGGGGAGGARVVSGGGHEWGVFFFFLSELAIASNFLFWVYNTNGVIKVSNVLYIMYCFGV
jgi:hypothetical protein